MRAKSWGRRINSALISVLAVFLMINSASAKYSGGTGEPNDPYWIATANDMNEIGVHPNDWDEHFILTADIDLSGLVGAQFNIIAPDTHSGASGHQGTKFTGVFDGNDHSISNFTYTSSGTNYIGLFGYLGSGGEIKNLGLIDANVDATGMANRVGALVGDNSGTISNCYAAANVDATVTGDPVDVGGVGGLVGFNDGTVSHCYISGNVVTGEAFDFGAVGGLVGFNDGGMVTDCHAIATVTATATDGYVGGLVGWNEYGTVSNCHAAGTVTSTGRYNGKVGGLVGFNDGGMVTDCHAIATVTATVPDAYVGGLVGWNQYGTVLNCYATGAVTGGSAGGLVAFNDGSISDCYATGAVTGGSAGGLVEDNEGAVSRCYATGTVSGEHAGGLVGGNLGTVLDCYATGTVSGDGAGGLVGVNVGAVSNCYATGSVTGGDAGGLVGRNYNGTISNCYAAGHVSGSGDDGGLVGYNYESDILASFWDTETTGEGDGVGLNEGSGTVEVYGRTTAEMESESTFTDAGWDFVGETANGTDDIWTIFEGRGYPRLWWEPTAMFVDADAPGANSGRSWADAYRYLQDALAAAQGGDDVWVAQGVYKPDANSSEPNGSGEREATFELIRGVVLRGGYAGYGAADPNARDLSAYETVLSGDVGTADVNADNSFHVVTALGMDANTVLDGFTITGGYADDELYPGYYGGGMLIQSAFCPTVTNCRFIGNRGEWGGGGIYNSGSNAAVANCTFIANSAGWGWGGGGGIYNYDSNATVSNCKFVGNTTGENGGGIYNYDSNATVSNCTFMGNSADYGGGIYNVYGSPTVSNCTFIGNSASQNGGGMSNEESSRPTVTNCTFSGNTATRGGGMSSEQSSPTVTNCTFSLNGAPVGGGIYELDSDPNIINCILWGNDRGELCGTGYTVSYSDIRRGYPGGGIGNIDVDPLFVDAYGPDNAAGTEDDDLRVLFGSACIDAGDNNSVPADIADLDGDGDSNERTPVDLWPGPRFLDDPCTVDTGVPDPPAYPNIVDMGAYEYDPRPVYFADANLKAAVEARLGISNPTRTDMGRLWSLDAADKGIADLTGLEYAINLWTLGLKSNDINSLPQEVFSGLTSLHELDLGENNINNLGGGAFSGLVRLEWLYLQRNQICSLPDRVFSGLTSLHTLDLSENNIDKLGTGAFSGLVRLEWLYLQRNQICSLPSGVFSDLSRLCWLFLQFNGLSDISALSEVVNLEHLELGRNPLNTAAYCVYLPLIEDNNPGITLIYDSNPNPISWDCLTDFPDFAYFAAGWLRTDCDGFNDWCGGADLNHDGVVDWDDLGEFVTYWLAWL